MNEQIGNVILNYKYYPGMDSYSDGEVEDELLDIVQNYEEMEFNRIIAERNKWAIMYHLSHLRSNIIEWLPISKDQKVLEIGAGCGAITGTLANKAKKVTCIELSKKRSLINAYRNKNKDNIEILVGNFEDIEKDIVEKYDYITLIGVFEYGEAYISSERPYENFLKIIKKHLKENGKIIIAIENKLGLKYWAGCKEDHVGRYFESIEGYPNTYGVKTFSKKELEEIVKSSGFNNYKFYYPYPDYKLPTSIYSDDYLPKKGELNNNIRNFDAERMILFDESKTYNSILREGLFHIYSNSYLVFLEKGESSCKNIIYSRYSNERDDLFKIRTSIMQDSNGNRFVRKVALTLEAQKHINNIYKNYNLLSQMYKDSKIRINKCSKIEEGLEFEYIEGKTLSEELDEILLKKNYTKLFEIIKGYVTNIEARIEKKNFELTEEFIKVFGKVKLPSYLKAVEITNIDLIFSNIIISDKWNVIDYEWTFNFPIPFNFIIYRAISGYIFNSNQRNELIKLGLYKLLGITDEEMQIYDRMERNFEKNVLGGLIPLNDLYGRTIEPNINIQEIVQQQKTNDIKNTIQVFYDYGEGFSEENSYKIFPTLNENNKVVLDIDIKSNIKQIRVDPCNCYSLVNIDSVVGYTTQYYALDYYTNGIKLNNRTLLFTNNDPQIILINIKPETNRIELILDIQTISKEFTVELCKFIQEKEDEIKNKEDVINEFNKKIEELEIELKDKVGRIEKYNKMPLIKRIRKQI